MNLQIKGIECRSANEAFDRIDAEDPAESRKVISVGGKVLVVEPAEAERIAGLGIAFAYLFEHRMPDGSYRIMSVPVND